MCSSNGMGSHGFSIVVGVVCSGGLSLPLAVISEHVVPTCLHRRHAIKASVALMTSFTVSAASRVRSLSTRRLMLMSCDAWFHSGPPRS